MWDRLLPIFGKRKRLSFDEIRSVQAIADQVVLCLEQTMRLPGDQKKDLALKVALSLCEDSGILCPLSVVETAVEASVRVMNLLEGSRLASVGRPEDRARSEPA